VDDDAVDTLGKVVVGMAWDSKGSVLCAMLQLPEYKHRCRRLRGEAIKKRFGTVTNWRPSKGNSSQTSATAFEGRQDPMAADQFVLHSSQRRLLFRSSIEAQAGGQISCPRRVAIGLPLSNVHSTTYGWQLRETLLD